jgi:hypothetical protein
MARFFKLTTEISQIVRKANLRATQLKIWLYFTEIDHYFSRLFSKTRSPSFVSPEYVVQQRPEAFPTPPNLGN